MHENESIRAYETTVILQPTMDDAGIEQEVASIKSHVESTEGEVVRSDIWGRRKLAYQIGRFREGVYVFFLFNGTPATVAEVERRYQINENVIRYLTVRAEGPIDATTPIGLSDGMDPDDLGRGRGDRRGDRPFRPRRRFDRDDDGPGDDRDRRDDRDDRDDD